VYAEALTTGQACVDGIDRIGARVEPSDLKHRLFPKGESRLAVAMGLAAALACALTVLVRRTRVARLDGDGSTG